MNEPFTSRIPLPEFSLWNKFKRGDRKLVSFDLEVTARCNNDCRHCYVNLPVQNQAAIAKELTLSEIQDIADEAVGLGAMWVLVTGGEPLLRKDFFDLYLSLKKSGLLVSVFTNATLITPKHIEWFKRYPPRDIEVTVYGVSEQTYERVTQKSGTFKAFQRGLNLLLENNIPVRLKAMALRSNVYELKEISTFCREKTKDYFRFDPLLHLRFDGDRKRNEEIKSERLSAEEIVAVEKGDQERFKSLENNCDRLIFSEIPDHDCRHLFHCGAGNGSFNVSYDGFFRLCSSLCHPDCVYDLRTGTLRDAWENFVPRVRAMHSDKEKFLNGCRKCPIVNLCIWCPAHAALETGKLDESVDYFCQVAHARKDMLNEV